MFGFWVVVLVNSFVKDGTCSGFSFVHLLFRRTSEHALCGEAPLELGQMKLGLRQWLRLGSQAGGSPASVMLRVGEDSVYGGDIEDQGHRRGAPAGS